MRYVVANCATTRDHGIHVSEPRPSMYQCEEGLEVRICPGGRVGDRRIREADSIADLAEEVRRETTEPTPSSGGGLCHDEPDEPDYEAILEARAEARAEEAIERAEAAYERYIYGD